jgi:hypothetical protein
MEGKFLMASILLPTPWRYSLSHLLQQSHRWSDEKLSHGVPSTKYQRDLIKGKE